MNPSQLKNQNMKQLLLIFSLAMLGLPKTYSQEVSFSELDSLLIAAPKPVLVFIHTDWCKYCLGMQQVTFSDEEVQKLLKEEVYFVSLDAESEEDIVFRNHRFRFQPSGRGTGVHELAYSLGNQQGELSYPTTCILNADYEIDFQFSGFIPARKMKRILGDFTE